MNTCVWKDTVGPVANWRPVLTGATIGSVTAAAEVATADVGVLGVVTLWRTAVGVTGFGAFCSCQA
ncbi:protein of unknown function [Acidithiobacillus ferrivorans]|uniref:Uncharacterized protein n=1 Tax=Acidithiobacillus ferrivorans TaxID=160808 RepID=A0A060UT82_9PROT|nr:hypothetical protein AFERRI_560169 [Acidithiobacillus ferrivorans]SMH66097.1 protein of unknown function [Acidithiobacillus ferrivorans]